MIKAFILSAGFSTRLRPITEHIPKPLLPLAGEVLLEYVYRLLKLSGAKQIGINLHYKAEQIEKFIRNSNLEATLFHEREILNTGGALYNAKDFLKDSIFIVHNADIYWDGNIKSAINQHIKRGNAITLLVHDHPPDNKLLGIL
jgi:Nucleoside-diphosphate-sugar pyrophosphorylase involved in lipopolysaccharide biosynthesis/translation initiation factor 2B, gamma/epsilon subunits (eIF-2Bgamma/eIF-2Bepsilon)